MMKSLVEQVHSVRTFIKHKQRLVEIADQIQDISIPIKRKKIVSKLVFEKKIRHKKIRAENV